jgi:CRP-like cAMP-binding protein
VAAAAATTTISVARPIHYAAAPQLATTPRVLVSANAAAGVADLALIRRVRFLAAMSPPSLDRLSQAAQWMDVAGGDVVIRQGDSGDAFFIVDQGHLSIAVDGMAREHTLGPGDGFGEIALLRDVPRTATVTALESCRLLRLERTDFRAAITGSADGLMIAEQVAPSHLDRDARQSES